RALHLTLFPYTTLFRSPRALAPQSRGRVGLAARGHRSRTNDVPSHNSELVRWPVQLHALPRADSARRKKFLPATHVLRRAGCRRSEEHTSELQSPDHLV